MKAFIYWLFTLCLRILIIIEIKFFKYSAITSIGRESRDHSWGPHTGITLQEMKRTRYINYVKSNIWSCHYFVYQILIILIDNCSENKIIHKWMSYNQIRKRLFGRNQPESELSRPQDPGYLRVFMTLLKRNAFPFIF